MLTHNQVRFISDLRHSSHRHDTGLFLAEGHRLVTDMLHSGAEILTIYALESWLYQNLALCKLKSITPQLVSEQLMGRLSALTNPSPVLALVKIPTPPVEEIPVSTELVLLLDDIRDPGNLGTIIRSADWFGIRHICLTPGSVDLYNTKVVQATMGSIIRVNHYEVEPEPWLRALPAGTPVVGTVLNGENIYTASLPSSGVIVIGNEGRGIGREIQQLLSNRLTIPAGTTNTLTAESLNAGVAAALVMSEFTRRKLCPGQTI